MIWHIFKKDWKLLWPLVALVAAVQLMNAAIGVILGHFAEPPQLAIIGLVATGMVFLGMTVLIVATVHQEAIPGVRQDWLIRPVRRRDLILAKLLFLLIAVHGPMFLADLGQGLAIGFAFEDSLSAAMSRGAYVLLAGSLPVFALAAMTRTLVEFVASVLAIGLVLLVILIMSSAFSHSISDVPNSGMAWLTGMWGGLWLAVMLAAAIVIIPLQYFRRATLYTRGIALGAILLAQALAFIPWAPAFSFQQWLSADPAAANPIAVAFDPALGQLPVEPPIRARGRSLWLPVRVSGLAPGSMMITDRADVRIIDRDGAILFRGRTIGRPGGFGRMDDFPVRAAAGGDVRTHRLIAVPRAVYERARGRPVRLELDYYFTLFRIDGAGRIAALSGDKRLAGLGWCKTGIDRDGDAVLLGCLTTGGMATCVTSVLENPLNGRRNPAEHRCWPDYWPFAADVPYDLFGFMGRSGQRLRFIDPQGLAKYPVDSAQIANAQVTLKSYRPVAHFRRQLVIPAIRLADWEAVARETAANAAP